jgi:hypothetical protein
MSRAEENQWYGETVPWTEKQLEDYYRFHGFVLMQRMNIVRGGIPPREDINAMLAAPRKTDVPPYWICELSKARDQLDEAEQLPDGSEWLITLIDSALEIEERAISFLNRN